VGIATGLVVVGDLTGSGEAQERGIVGETPNLAARLQGMAEPNTVVIADGTRRLLGNLFEFDDLGGKDLKGIAGPVRAWAALRGSSVESRFEALRTATTPLVGREEEVDLLLRRWEQAKHGDGGVVLISGEPGIGKSRIAQTIVERLGGEPHTRLRFFCLPHHQDSALYPSIAQLERAAGFRREDTAEQRLEKLEAVLAQEPMIWVRWFLSWRTSWRFRRATATHLSSSAPRNGRRRHFRPKWRRSRGWRHVSPY
jgi:hypothetical protein